MISCAHPAPVRPSPSAPCSLHSATCLSGLMIKQATTYTRKRTCERELLHHTVNICTPQTYTNPVKQPHCAHPASVRPLPCALCSRWHLQHASSRQAFSCTPLLCSCANSRVLTLLLCAHPLEPGVVAGIYTMAHASKQPYIQERTYLLGSYRKHTLLCNKVLLCAHPASARPSP
jgi:hypothetical protein